MVKTFSRKQGKEKNCKQQGKKKFKAEPRKSSILLTSVPGTEQRGGREKEIIKQRALQSLCNWKKFEVVYHTKAEQQHISQYQEHFQRREENWSKDACAWGYPTRERHYAYYGRKVYGRETLSILVKCYAQATKMAQWGKELPTLTEVLSSIPGRHMMDGVALFIQAHTVIGTSVPVHTHMQRRR